MTDPDLDLEQVLDRYTVVEPPGDLKGRALGAAYAAMRARRLAWAAAAAVVVAVALQWQAGRTYSAIAAPEIQAREAERSAQVASIAETLGGGDEAVRAATLIFEESARAVAVIPAALEPQPEEWAR